MSPTGKPKTLTLDCNGHATSHKHGVANENRLLNKL